METWIPIQQLYIVIQLLFPAQEWYTDVAMDTELKSVVEKLMVSADQIGICTLVMQSVEESQRDRKMMVEDILNLLLRDVVCLT